MVKNKRPCEICGSESLSEFIHQCKRCYNLRKDIDKFIKEDIISATDFLLDKLSNITKKRLLEKQRLYIKSLNLKPYKIPEPIKTSPNELKATIVATYVVNRLTTKTVSSGTHIKLLDDIEFQRLHRDSSQLLCKPGFIQKEYYYTERNLECKRCIKMAKSLERRGIEIIYLNKDEINDYYKSKEIT